jgi:hypothetical protein
MKRVALLLSAMIAACWGLSVKVQDSTPICMTIEGNASQYLHFSYQVRGRNAD